MKSKAGEQHEILIIRRGGGDDNAAPKGGAWKIAYADFVTAMMAFFLVMWLINSANEVTKARVASYFNPIKMTDASPARRGLKEEIDAQSPNNRGEEQKSGGDDTTEKPENAKPVGTLSVSDDKLLMNPYAILEELLRHSQEASSGAATEEVAAVGDPFNPRSFEYLPELQAESAAAKDATKGEGSRPADVSEMKLDETHADKPLEEANLVVADQSSAAVKLAQEGAEIANDVLKALPTEMAAGADPAIGKVEQEPLEKVAEPLDEKASATPQEVALAQELREQIETLIDKFRGKIDVVAKVKMTTDGLLIVLEDGQGRSMFSVGSAQPNPALIEIIGNIGKILAKAEGNIIIRGHTDGRQFRNNKYDNWQLSTDRAHMASYMLIRGGLAESRVKRIEGYGASSPVVPNETMLDANRRVEFLVVK